MNLTIEQVLTKPIDELTTLYKQGYTLEQESPSTLCNKCNKMKNMATVEMTKAEALISIIASVAIGSLIYYKVGKWEAKKLGWD